MHAPRHVVQQESHHLSPQIGLILLPGAAFNHTMDPWCFHNMESCLPVSCKYPHATFYRAVGVFSGKYLHCPQQLFSTCARAGAWGPQGMPESPVLGLQACFCCAALYGPALLVFFLFGITFVLLLVFRWGFRCYLYPQKGVLSLSDVFRIAFSHVVLCHSSPSSDSFCEQAKVMSMAEAPVEPNEMSSPSGGGRFDFTGRTRGFMKPSKPFTKQILEELRSWWNTPVSALATGGTRYSRRKSLTQVLGNQPESLREIWCYCLVLLDQFVCQPGHGVGLKHGHHVHAMFVTSALQPTEIPAAAWSRCVCVWPGKVEKNIHE